MAEESIPESTRFPWGYALATLFPLLFVAGVYTSQFFLEPPQAMGPAMLSSILIGPSGLLVAGWGGYRLWRGEGRRHPALRWLIAVPLALGAAGFLLG